MTAAAASRAAVRGVVASRTAPRRRRPTLSTQSPGRRHRGAPGAAAATSRAWTAEPPGRTGRAARRPVARPQQGARPASATRTGAATAGRPGRRRTRPTSRTSVAPRLRTGGAATGRPTPSPARQRDRRARSPARAGTSQVAASRVPPRAVPGRHQHTTRRRRRGPAPCRRGHRPRRAARPASSRRCQPDGPAQRRAAGRGRRQRPRTAAPAGSRQVERQPQAVERVPAGSSRRRSGSAARRRGAGS